MTTDDISLNLYQETKRNLAVHVATKTALPSNTYSSGILRAVAVGSLGTIDGFTTVVGNAILVKNETTTAENNGIYTVVDIGSSTTQWVLARRDDMKHGSTLVGGTIISVGYGTINASSQWITQNALGAVVGTNDPAIVANTGQAIQACTTSDTILSIYGLVTYSGASGQTLTLPSATVGQRIDIWNIGTTNGVAIARAGSDTITDNLTTGATTFNLPAGARCSFICVTFGVWIAFYSSTVTKVAGFNVSAGTGSKSFTGLGFRPKSVNVWSGYTDGAFLFGAQGYFDAAGNQKVQAYSLNAGTPAERFQSAACVYTITNSGSTATLATFTSMDVDGFTLNFSTTDTGTVLLVQAIA